MHKYYNCINNTITLKIIQLSETVSESVNESEWLFLINPFQRFKSRGKEELWSIFSSSSLIKIF